MMKILSTRIPDLMIAEATPHQDTRGAFARWFCEKELRDFIGDRHIVQINHSRTLAVGALRGLHFQHSPHAEIKLVRCLAGKVWDVAVDLRRHSSTFLQWHAEELSLENRRMMIIPEGFAHGFQVLLPGSELLYLHTAFYSPDAEGGLRYDDPRLGINWPLAVNDLSGRDKQHALIDDNFQGLVV
jgi:dTDP-4-dehydrorhamnose 3,5-epimerase